MPASCCRVYDALLPSIPRNVPLLIATAKLLANLIFRLVFTPMLFYPLLYRMKHTLLFIFLVPLMSEIGFGLSR
ncbi:hypothetical protein ASPTUDRAFT_735373 [Aspergillus tubingensis CBS 134.48]|uniref:Uncharacterized protein n=1 Tax=Aspergillus tubingensis (strain CBS 134.48) TaxID=767770 RepID=A0A1L9MXR2_ASPTC|nr:hypothetical protein ASPTUDRAFT_735373 [Aspergillus tubingensis CBS 134.48]